jgi:hypothetical protein
MSFELKENRAILIRWTLDSYSVQECCLRVLATMIFSLITCGASVILSTQHDVTLVSCLNF